MSAFKYFFHPPVQTILEIWLESDEQTLVPSLAKDTHT